MGLPTGSAVQARRKACRTWTADPDIGSRSADARQRGGRRAV